MVNLVYKSDLFKDNLLNLLSNNKIPKQTKPIWAITSVNIPPGVTGFTSPAAFAKATVLESKGQFETAAHAYARAFACDSTPSMMHVVYGRLLCRLGRSTEALAEFEAGMETEVTGWSLPSLPRHFPDLADSLAANFSIDPE